MAVKRGSKEQGDKTIITDARLTAPHTPKDRPILRSREEGDKPILTDAMFNFVAGSSFEIGSSLAILDNPGESGAIIDGYAKRVSEIINTVYNTPIGDTEIVVDPSKPDKKTTLREYFDTKILKELKPDTDQIGRCRDEALNNADWYKGKGEEWLQKQLTTSSSSPEYEYTNMLTKMRTISATGTVLRELMVNCKDTAAKLVGSDVKTIEERSDQITTQIRHLGFDNVVTRARTEKTPIVEGVALTAYKGVAAETVDAGPVGLGFGKVWHKDGMSLPETDALQTHQQQLEAKATQAEVIAKYQALEKAKGRQGLPRVGQDIKDAKSPGLLGESSQALIPEAFKESGLPGQLATHQFEHGSGLNRWQLTGTYPRQSWNQSLPAAGGHSGGTSDIFLAINCLDSKSIFGKPEAEKAGLLVSSFMNFGGYHSFVETFPIAQAIAADSTFTVKVGREQRKLYADMNDIVQQNGTPKAASIVSGHLESYRETISAIDEAKQQVISAADVTGIELPQEDTDALATKDVVISNPAELAESLAKIADGSELGLDKTTRLRKEVKTIRDAQKAELTPASTTIKAGGPT